MDNFNVEDEYYDSAEDKFLSNVPKSTRRYVGRATGKTLTFKRDARAASDKAANDIGNEAEAARRHAGPLGAFSDTSSSAEIVEGIDGRPQLVVTVRGNFAAASGRGSPFHSLGFYTKEIQMKANSVLTIGFAVALSLVSLCAVAQTRCSTDSFGNTTCRDSSGNTTRGSTDSFGNSTWRDSNGNTTRGSTDSFGNSTFRDSNGNTTRCNNDSFGNITCR